ncbi:site-specific DNA-methyltransferase [Clostridium intestinale]|uniref:Methyltransferase n=1 Tax=Clostridium intestinale TaxID=36845 RepID=A0A7D6VT95_9CLOT|nr:site-specific DNA-methyltransferase [Clostridium intestinale]
MNKIHNLDCREGLKLLEDNSIDCCITSPPYWGLRDYGIDGQIGLEDTLQEYIDELVNIFREVKRVLKPTGTLWLNMGDCYVGTGGDRKKAVKNELFQTQQAHNPKEGRYERKKTLLDMNLKPKDLIGLPWRIAFKLQEDGWYLRSDIVWSKTNCMPESVKDRPTKAHEYIFLLSKEPYYYYDYEAIKEQCVNGDPNPPRGSKGVLGNLNKGNRERFNIPGKVEYRNKRSVWEVSTDTLKQAHFATFPPKLIEPCVLAGCKQDGIILDPFSGSGTTGMVAMKNNRNFIGFELNPEYIKIAEKFRLNEIQLKII